MTMYLCHGNKKSKPFCQYDENSSSSASPSDQMSRSIFKVTLRKTSPRDEKTAEDDDFDYSIWMASVSRDKQICLKDSCKHRLSCIMEFQASMAMNGRYLRPLLLHLKSLSLSGAHLDYSV